MLYQRGHRTRLEPVVVGVSSVESTEHAERSIDVLAVSREMISVIVLLHQGVCLVGRNLQILCLFLDTGTQHGVKFLLSYATQPGVFIVHGYLRQIVQLREDAEL